MNDSSTPPHPSTEYADDDGLVPCAACAWAGGWWDDEDAGVWVRCNGCAACASGLVLAEVGDDPRARIVVLQRPPDPAHVLRAKILDVMARGWTEAEATAVAS